MELKFSRMIVLEARLHNLILNIEDDGLVTFL